MLSFRLHSISKANIINEKPLGPSPSLSPGLSLSLPLFLSVSVSLYLSLSLALPLAPPGNHDKSDFISLFCLYGLSTNNAVFKLQFRTFYINSSLGSLEFIIQVDSATDNQKHHHFWGNSWWMLGTRQAAVSRAFSPLPRCKVAWSHLQTAATPLPPARGSAGRGPCSPHSARQGCGSAPGRAAPPHAGSSPQEAAKVWQLGLPAPGEVNVPSK